VNADAAAEEAIRLYRDGLSAAAAARKTGLSYRKVLEAVHGAGIMRRSHGGPPRAGEAAGTGAAEAAAILQACTTGGMTRAQAGALHGVSRRIVSRVLRQAGLLAPDAAAALAGITPEELRALGAAGRVRRTGRIRAAGSDRRCLYFRDDMLSLASSRQATSALRWAWDGLYQISETADGLEAWRTDGTGSLLAAAAGELRDAIREDYPKYAAGMEAGAS
jgi:hypothetical protein